MLEMGVSNNALVDWAKSHGKYPPVYAQDGCYLFADGSSFFGRMFHPAPADDQRRLHSMRRYHLVLLERVSRDLDNLRKGLKWPQHGDWRLAHYKEPPLTRAGQPDEGAARSRLVYLVKRCQLKIAELKAYLRDADLDAAVGPGTLLVSNSLLRRG